jgi:hypothetical protein
MHPIPVRLFSHQPFGYILGVSKKRGDATIVRLEAFDSVSVTGGQ